MTAPSLSALIAKEVWWPGHQDVAVPVAPVALPHAEPRPTGKLAPASEC